MRAVQQQERQWQQLQPQQQTQAQRTLALMLARNEGTHLPACVHDPSATRYIGVGPTNAHTARDQVALIMSPYGEIESVLMQPQHGFACVTMRSVEHAVRARANLNGRTIGEGLQRVILEVQYLLTPPPVAAGGITHHTSAIKRKASQLLGCVEDEDEW
eukprot:1553827-Prymnesium_polylepis.1